MPLIAESSSLPFAEIQQVRKGIAELRQEKNQLETRLQELNMKLGGWYALYMHLFQQLSAYERAELEGQLNSKES